MTNGTSTDLSSCHGYYIDFFVPNGYVYLLRPFTWPSWDFDLQIEKRTSSTPSLIIHTYPEFHQRGGVERYLWELSKRQLEHHHVAVLAQKSDSSSKHPGLRLHRAKLPPLPQPLLTLMFSVWSFIAAQKLRREFPRSIVHAQGASCLGPDLVTAQSVHKVWFLKSLRGATFNSAAFWRKLLNPIHYATILVETIQYRWCRSTHVVAISEIVKRELRDAYAIPASRISVIYSGVHIDQFSPERQVGKREALRRQWEIPDSHLALSFVANEFRRKGLITLLRALTIVPDPRISLIVAGRDDHRRYDSTVSRLGLQDRVRFIGSSSDVPGLLASSDAFVFPTLYEPFGLVITEAMAAERPVITSSLAGAAELIKHGENGLLIHNPSSESDLAALIQQLLDPALRSRLGKAARQSILPYSWESVSKQYDKVYEGILDVRKQT